MCKVYYKGVAEYSAEVFGLQLREAIEKKPSDFGIEHPTIEKVTLESKLHDGKKDKLIIKFHIDNVKTSEEAYCITKDIADNIFCQIAYFFDVLVGPTSFDGAPISKDVFNEDGTKLTTAVMPLTVNVSITATALIIPGPERIKLLLKEIQLNNPERNLYYSLYRFASQFTDPISRYLILYGTLLLLTGDSQKNADNFIRSNEKGVLEKPSRARNVNGKMETIYTYLRNEIGHPPKTKKMEDTLKEVKEKVNGLASLVKTAIQQLIKD